MAQGVMAIGRNGPFPCGLSAALMDAIAFLSYGALQWFLRSEMPGSIGRFAPNPIRDGAHFCFTEGFTVHIFLKMVLCMNCAPIDHFQSVGLRFEREAEASLILS
jgi:hypothetical protein